MVFTLGSFVLVTVAVAFVSWLKTKGTDETSKDGYFLGGRSLSGLVIFGSLMMTNLSAEQLVGRNGQGYAAGMTAMGWETMCPIALTLMALFFIPKYFKLGISTIPEFLESRFDRATRVIVSFIFLVAYIVTMLPLVLYAGSVAMERIFGITALMGGNRFMATTVMCVALGIIGGIYAIFGGLKAVAVSDSLNGIIFIIGAVILIPVLAFIALGMVFSVGLAIMISLLHNKRASKVYQTMMFFPYFMSWVVASYFLDAFLNQDNGLINSIMRNAGKEPIQWYMSAGVWPFILIFMYLWKSTGYNMVIYLSSISGIDTTLYEAAVMDGANKRQQVWHITLPCLKSVIIMMFILNVGKVFYSDFGLFFQLSQGASGSIFKTTATIDTYVYNALQSSTPIGMTSAATFFQSVACCITILLANAIVKKIDEDSAII